MWRHVVKLGWTALLTAIVSVAAFTAYFHHWL